MNLVFATQNRNKALEIQALMPQGITIQTLSDIGCTTDIPEDADTLQGNAELKAKFVADNYNVACFADDTGLEIEALDMRPGVYSARYAGTQRSDEANIQKVLTELEGNKNRKAQFRTAICLMIHGETYHFEGKVEGAIRTKKAGAEGFGYDPVFEPEGCGITFAEMSREEKNKRSHRARAFEKMIAFLRERK
ncbi:MAG: non-canonical purine NTP diphosphatase [Crocinitomicaceae bacterium]|nr:non-canonical purine NTP diphosphatase [Crocinitomicaceae bacterium]